MNTVGVQRLAAMRLVGERCATPAGAVRWLGCLQGQDLPGALESVALRTVSGSVDEVRAAFDDGALVRSWPMRRTLHVVAATDLAWMLPLATARPLADAAKRREQLGLADAGVERAGEVAEQALRGGRRLTRGELAAVWADAGLELGSNHVTHVVSVLAMRGLLVWGPFAPSGKEQALVLLDEWVPTPRRLDREDALVAWALAFFRSHGPARRADFLRWTGLPAKDADRGIDGAREHLTAGPDGVLADPHTADRLAAVDDPGAELLLPGFDEFVLGYADRTEVLDAAHADRICPGGNGVFRPTVVRDGRVVGTWTRKGTGRNRRVERELF